MPSHHPRKKIRSHPTTDLNKINSSFQLSTLATNDQGTLQSPLSQPGSPRGNYIQVGVVPHLAPALWADLFPGPAGLPQSLAQWGRSAGAPGRGPSRPARGGSAPEAGTRPTSALGSAWPGPGPTPCGSKDRAVAAREAGTPGTGWSPGQHRARPGPRRAADTGEPAAPT